MSRYVLLSEFFPPKHGGIEDTIGKIAQWLGSDVTCIVPPAPGDEVYDRSLQGTVIRRSLFSGRQWPHWGWLVGWLRKHRPEVIIFGHYSLAVTAAWILRRPFAIVVHGHDVLSSHGGWRGWLLARQCRAARWIAVNSEFMTKTIMTLGVRRSAIVTLHPMIDHTRLIQAVPDVDRPRLVTVCRLVERKNVRLVIEAVSELRADFPDIHYDIIGDGPERSLLLQSIQSHHLEQHVTVHGWVDEEKKWDILHHSTVGVMVPTARGSDVEGFGLFFIEASTAGLPVVGSRTGGIADAIVDKETGLLVPPDDRAELVRVLRSLLRDPDYSHRLGRHGQAYIQREFLSTVRQDRFLPLVQKERQPHPPRVSVIIPAYQAANTIVATLRDVFQQTWKNLEVIVVDDGSTDGLASVLAPLSDRVQYIQQQNLGAAAARNRGADHAQGHYLLFLDADIRLSPEMVTDMVVALQTHPFADFVYCNFRFGPKGFHLFEFDLKRLQRQNYIHTSSVMRRTAFPRFDPTLKKFQDWDLWLTMAERGSRGLWIPRELFRVQQRSGGYSTWLPKFMYRLPWIGQGKGSRTIARYRQGEDIIRRKHHLPGLAE